ncbi:MAG: efflux RND transporter periplasmic adaptor subunit [Giesbergeria sp.]|nr:efflux RND transporter periplasmic adaptor subunit [Giesbergeria sp.]MBP9893759.1 efflux RND transporter periplasmic adaptor subunit [Giesbergeria sp.]
MKKPHLALMAGSALLVLTGHAGAHGDEDHSQSTPPAAITTVTTAAAMPGTSTAPQRLEDGSLFVPKAVQRQLGLRTRVAVVQELAVTVELAGTVVADARAGGLVQAGQAGRVEATGAGLPVLGQTVRKGELLAQLRPVLSSMERGSNLAQMAEIAAQLAIAERKVARYAQLEGAVPQATIDAARLERDALRQRRSALGSGLSQAEALRAPISGVVSAAHAVAGQVVDAKDVLFEVIDPARLSVEALAYDPLPAGGVTRASAAVPGGALDLAYVGSGRQLREQAQVLLFRVQPGGPAVAVGQPLTVLATTAARVHGAAVPRSALVKTATGETAVWVHTAAERFVQRPVTAQALGALELAVTQGLAQGERVVTDGAALLAQVR